MDLGIYRGYIYICIYIYGDKRGLGTRMRDVEGL